MRGRGLKVSNEYAEALGRFFDETPKAVFAAIAYSFTVQLFGEGNERLSMIEEWEALHTAGIVPQRAPNRE